MANWGILGCGGIARHMASALKDVKDAKLLACAARDQARADKLAAEFSIERAYGSYEAMLADPDIEIVYVAVVNTYHWDTVRMCIEAGKAVICEKPLAMSEEEGERMFALAKEKGVLLMEAIWTLFLPAWKEVKRRIEEGVIGDLRFAQIDFTFGHPCTIESRLYDPARGGGGLLDVGVYTAHVAQYIFGPSMPSIHAAGRKADTGVDGFAAVTLKYPEGPVACLTCGIDSAGVGDARIFGAHGWIHVPGMFCADHFVIHRGGQPDERVDFGGRDGFCYQAEEFQRLYEEGKTVSDIASPEVSLRVAHILDESMRQVLE